MKTLARHSAAVITALTLTSGLAVGAAQEASAAPAPVTNLHSTSCPSWIQQGQTSGCVTRLQQLLNTKQGSGLAVDGIFGAATKTAVVKWQSGHGLYADGIVGANTKDSIDPVAPKSRNQAVVDATNALMNGTKYYYTWGGGHGPTPGKATYGRQNSTGTKMGYGFDCSGFARAAYAKAFGYDKLGAGTAANQSTKGVVTTNPQPGDLVFYSRSTSSNWTTVKANVGHVAVYMGGGRIAHQSTYGTVQHWGVTSSNLGYAKKFYVHYTG